MYVLRTGCRWQDLPDAHGIAPTTAWRRLRRWEENGTWDALQTVAVRCSRESPRTRPRRLVGDRGFVRAGMALVCINRLLQ